jgi:hypothetical protein
VLKKEENNAFLLISKYCMTCDLFAIDEGKKLLLIFQASLSRSAQTIILEKKQSEDSIDLMVVLGEQDNPSEQTGKEGNESIVPFGSALNTL